MAMGRNAWTEARTMLTKILSADEGVLRDNKELLKTAVLPMVGFSLTRQSTFGAYSTSSLRLLIEGRCHLTHASQHR